MACNDDGEEIAPHSRMEVLGAPAGSYAIVVERPVLDSGATCDPTGAENRCADGPCNTGTCP